MAKRGRKAPALPETVISIIGPGMRIMGDCESTDTIRVEGVVEGCLKADKAVVVGRDARVVGDIRTADAKIAGSVKGALDIQSRLELASTSVIDGEIRAALMQLDEGGVVNGTVTIGRQGSDANQGAPANGPAAKQPLPGTKAASSGRPSGRG